MSTFRGILAIIFSLLIVGGVWKYYTSNDQVSVQDPFKRVWQKIATYDAPAVNKTGALLDSIPSTDRDSITGPMFDQDIHEDFSFGTMTAADLIRLSQLGALGGSPDGDILWLHYCDFDATYCQTSYDEGIVYDYLEAYPTDLSYIYKPFPPTTLDNDLLPHRAALCAADNGTTKQFFAFYNAIYAEPEEASTINQLIALGRSLGIDTMGDCLDQNNYDLVIQQETKFARKLFDIKALPANIFINKTTLEWVLIPGYYETEEVLPGIAAIE